MHNYHDFQENDQSGDGGATLNFESRFECGNLRKAIHVGGRQYDLILSPDINSDKHHQWFYFQVKKITINNLLNSLMADFLLAFTLIEHFLEGITLLLDI